jgi:hypothetical protein
MLEAQGLEVACAPFLEFLQIASTQPTVDNVRPVPLQDEMGVARHVIRPAVVKSRHVSVLFRLLPDLRPGASTALLPDAFAMSMSTGLTSIAAEMHSDRRAREARAAKSTRAHTSRDKYGERIADSILLLTGAPDDDFLPTYYQESGGRQKGESERVILQREVDQSAEALGVLPFKVTPSQCIALKTFDFAGMSAREIGTGVLPFSIIPPDATSTAAVRAIVGNHANAEIFDLSGDPVSGALSTSDTQRLRNQKGYVVCNWNEARMQLRCNLALRGALCGDEHNVTLSWATMLRRFERVESRLQHAMDVEFGPCLAPALFVFHLQLIERDWFEEQIRTGQRFVLHAPEFAEHLRTFERQNNLSWLPSVSNVPALFSLRSTPRPLSAVTGASPRAAPETRASAPGRAAAPREQRDLGARVRNPARHARFTGNTAFVNHVRERPMDEAFALAGGRDSGPMVVRSGAPEPLCISWHAKGSCFELCTRCATHNTLSALETTSFHTWCDVAYA